MKNLFSLTWVLLSLMSLSCEPKATVELNEAATEIAMQFHRGELTQSPKRDAFFSLFKDGFIRDNFEIGGYDHRLDECITKWLMFEDSEHLVICGSVATSDLKSHAFVWVLSDDMKTDGKLRTVFFQIGRKMMVGHEYPRNLIPYKGSS